MEYEIHSFAARFPLIEGDEFDELVANIKEHGLNQPIALTADGRTIVDGRNRYRACVAVGMEPRFYQLPSDWSEIRIIDWIVSQNVHRRHLTTSQRSMLAAHALEYFEKLAKERQRTHGNTAPGRKNTSAGFSRSVERPRKSVGKKFKVGADSVQKAKKVIQVDPGLADRVQAGDISVDAAYQQVKDRPRAEPVVASKGKIILVTHDNQQIEYPQPASKSTFNQTNDQISWAYWSWNPVTGCLHGCNYCYARELALSPSYKQAYPVGFTPLFHSERLDAPGNTRVPDEAGNDLRKRRVFVCSMADLYGRWVPSDWIEQVHESCTKNPQWDYLMLTKFPARYLELRSLPPTAWLGTSVDEQKRVRIAEDVFRQIKGVRVKWLSLEPLCESLQFSDLSMFDWVVIGAQSQTVQPDGMVKAFAPPIEWVLDLIAQAREAGCRIYLKPNLLGIPNPQSPGMQLIQEEPVIASVHINGRAEQLALS